MKWNFQLRLDTNSLAAANLIEKIEAVDDLTLHVYVTEVDSLLWQTWGRNRVISPTAFEKAGNGDFEKSLDWARWNPVGTGPFELVRYERDAIIEYKKNDDYWREGHPYLDGIEIRIVADPTTAAAMMEAGQADYWLSPSSLVLEHKRLVEQLGFQDFRSDWGMVWALLPDSANPNSPFADKRVREAVEHAIDRDAIALMVGHGYVAGMTQLAPPYEIGYDPSYNPRPYNPQRAKELLAEAGYPNGFETPIITQATQRNRDVLTAIQGYLDAVGIKVHADIADVARYSAAVFTEGFEGMALTSHGADSTGRSIITHFGPAPRTFRTGNILKSPEYLEACQKMLASYDIEEFNRATAQAYRQASEDAMVIPIIGDFWLHTAQPYVRTHNKASYVWSSFHDYWLEEH